jgi:membrane associated rhomboid family serine protease
MAGAVNKEARSSASAEARRALRTELRGQLLVLGGTLALLWLIELVDFVVFHGRLDELGIRARTVRGLIGIPLHPFLHAGFGHLAANSVGLVLPGWFIVNRRKRDFFIVWALATLVGGLGTWLVAPFGRVDIGASGVVLGLMGFLIARGVFERRFFTILGSVAMLILWGGTIRAGLFPNDPHVSWQIHLFGLIGGVLAARVVRKRRAVPAAR